jgi:hypothetical protein
MGRPFHLRGQGAKILCILAVKAFRLPCGRFPSWAKPTAQRLPSTHRAAKTPTTAKRPAAPRPAKGNPPAELRSLNFLQARHAACWGHVWGGCPFRPSSGPNGPARAMPWPCEVTAFGQGRGTLAPYAPSLPSGFGLPGGNHPGTTPPRLGRLGPQNWSRLTAPSKIFAL